MKKSILLIMAFALSLSLSAQLKVGGSIGFMGQSSKITSDGTTNEGPTNTDITLLPNVEYMLSDNFSIGGKLGFSLDQSKNDAADSKTSLFMFHISPYARMYFPLGDKLSFFGEGGIQFARGTEKVTFGSTTNDGDTQTNFGIGVIPGLAYGLSDKVSLTLTAGFLGYQLTSINDNNDPEEVTKYNNYGFSINTSNISFGIKYIL
ncbi:MAG: porin family protein [Bacteroidales bacterium]|jgi:opacity protein-like surface antigen|nr:porin family protein [Bacteroidales bacterium]